MNLLIRVSLLQNYIGSILLVIGTIHRVQNHTQGVLLNTRGVLQYIKLCSAVHTIKNVCVTIQQKSSNVYKNIRIH
jgi:hypothetical protein